MEKPFMYIDQPNMDVQNDTMQTVFYSNNQKERTAVHIPTMIENVVCEVTLQDGKIRGEIVEEKETEILMLLEDGEERTIQKAEMEHVQIIRL